MQPSLKPERPNFSSGPTCKRPNWRIDKLDLITIGRSHRSSLCLDRINHLVDLTKNVLEIPETYHVGILPGSCTGAMEAAMWSLLGPRPVDFVSFDVFGNVWIHDGLKELKLKNTQVLTAPPGCLPDLSKVNPSHDVVFTYNGSTTGVCVPNGEWISDKREGLVICDAISALFSMSFPWEKMDVVSFAWQKGLGGEAAHGMLVLSPRAVERLESHRPPWPIPRVFRLAEEGKFSKRIFEGMTINTPSMFIIEDFIDALTWAQDIGGLPILISRSKANLKAVEEWVEKTPWIEFLVQDPEIRSSSTICLRFPEDPVGWLYPKAIASLLEDNGIAYGILGHTSSVPCLRIWGGPTVEASDIKALLPWITWAYEQVKSA